MVLSSASKKTYELFSKSEVFLRIVLRFGIFVFLKELFGGFEEKSIVVSVATCTALFSFISGMLILRGVDNDEKKDKESNVEYKTKDSTNELEEMTL